MPIKKAHKPNWECPKCYCKISKRISPTQCPRCGYNKDEEAKNARVKASKKV